MTNMNHSTNNITKRGLVVDDEFLDMEHAHKIVLSGGYIADSARNADDALALYIQQPYDFVLMDIRLTGKLNGVETAQMMMKIREIPVIYTTNYGSGTGYREQAKTSVKFQDYLLKPLQKEQTLISIEEILARFDAAKIQENEIASKEQMYSFMYKRQRYYVAESELVYLETINAKTTIHVFQNNQMQAFEIGYNITETVEEHFMQHPYLVQSAKPFYVNLDWIKNIGRDELGLKYPYEKKVITVGNKFKSELERRQLERIKVSGKK